MCCPRSPEHRFRGHSETQSGRCCRSCCSGPCARALGGARSCRRDCGGCGVVRVWTWANVADGPGVNERDNAGAVARQGEEGAGAFEEAAWTRRRRER